MKHFTIKLFTLVFFSLLQISTVHAANPQVGKPCPTISIQNGPALEKKVVRNAHNEVVVGLSQTQLDVSFTLPANNANGKWFYIIGTNAAVEAVNVQNNSFTISGFPKAISEVLTIEYRIPDPNNPSEYGVCCTWAVYITRPTDESTAILKYKFLEDSIVHPNSSPSCDADQSVPECDCSCKCDKLQAYEAMGSQNERVVILDSFNFREPLLVDPNEPGFDMGHLIIYRSKLGKYAKVSPRDLFFGSVPTMKILFDGIATSSGSSEATHSVSNGGYTTSYPLAPKDDAILRQFKIRQASGSNITFEVKLGSSIGYPQGIAVHSQARIQMLDENKQPTTSSTACKWVRQYRTGGGYVDYDRQTRNATTHVSRSGRVTDLLNKVEIIRDENGHIAQVKTAGGLINVTIINEDEFTVDSYEPTQIGAKVNGKYLMTGTPRVSNRIISSLTKIDHIRTHGTRAEKTRYEWTPQGIPLVVKNSTGGSFTFGDPNDGQSWKRTRYKADGVTPLVIQERKKVNSAESAVMKSAHNKNINTVVPKAVKIIRTTLIPGEAEPEVYRSESIRPTMLWNNDVTNTEVYEVGKRYHKSIKRSGDYFDDESKPGSFGKIKSHTLSRGITRGYVYDDVTGHMLSRTEAYLDNPTGKVITYDYTPHIAADTLDLGDFRPRTTTVTLNGVVASRNFFAASFDATTGEYTVISELAHSQTAAFGDPVNLRATSIYHAPNAAPALAGRLKKTISVDKVVTSYDYIEGSGLSDLTVIVTGNLDLAGNPVAGHSVRVTSILDSRGLLRSNTSAAYAIDRTNNNTPTWSDVASVTQTYDVHGYPLVSTEIDPITNRQRILMECVWTNGQKTSVTDELGVTSSFTYDGFYRVTSVTRSAIAASTHNGQTLEAQPAITTTISGNTLSRTGTDFAWKDTTTTVTAGGITLTSSQETDERGRVNKIIDENGYITTAVYNTEGTVATVTAPNTGTVTTNHYLDGRMKSQTGSALVDSHYAYTVNPTGGLTVEKSVVTAGNPRKVSCKTNMLGQTVSCTSPAFNGASVINTTNYEQSTGRVLSSSSTAANTPNSIIQYNSIGVPIRTGISIDDNALTLNSNDRIVDVETGIEKDAAGIWSFSKTYIYPESGSATRKLLGSSRSKATGYSGLDIAYAESTDIAGNLSSGNATLDRSTGITQIKSNTPGIATDSIATSYYGRLETTLTPGETNMALVDYDPLGRVRQTKNPRHAAYSTILYQANKTLVESTTNANGDTTAYQYNGNAQLGAGVVSQVTLPDNSTQHVTYDLLGNVTSQYGSQMYPRAYEYDAYNQLIKLHSWKTNPTAPLDPASGAATTTWNYEQSTGLLLNKRYADDKGTDYLYDTAGRTLTKTLARETTPGSGIRLQAQYFYTPWGEHKSTIYNDTLTKHTNNVYDRLGRQTHSIQGTTATQSTRVTNYQYDPNTLLQTSERIRDGIFINDLAKDYLTDNSTTYDKTLATGYDNLLRVNGINVPNATGTGNDYNLNYGYGTEGRLSSITDQLNSKTFGYNYNPNSRNLIDEMTAPIHNVVNAYEQNRGVLLSKTNSTTSAATAGIADISKFQYTVNSIGKRTKNILSGKAITDNGLANTTLTWDYTYNDKGELATANATSDNAAVAAINRTFTFDAIGNRTSITDNTGTKTYVSNALNQYQSITTTPDNGSPITDNRIADADGNVTNNGTHKYTFDAEDRLTEVKNQAGTILVSYRYDAYSRRIERTVPAGETTQYLYNSWNVIAEYKQLTSTTWELTTTRTWGLDISGSEQGAGGIGGLLAENQITTGTTSSYYPLYDGNGNITEYLDSTGSIVAHYEYDPFGKINLSTGAKAGDFEYQFSTKPLDTITGLHYYGYRWYDASNGRWINRDPIKEDGGLNVYNFCSGDPINFRDYLGLSLQSALDKLGVKSLDELMIGIKIDKDFESIMFNSFIESSDTYSTTLYYMDMFTPNTLQCVQGGITNAISIENRGINKRLSKDEYSDLVHAIVAKAVTATYREIRSQHLVGGGKYIETLKHLEALNTFRAVILSEQVLKNKSFYRHELLATADFQTSINTYEAPATVFDNCVYAAYEFTPIGAPHKLFGSRTIARSGNSYVSKDITGWDRTFAVLDLGGGALIGKGLKVARQAGRSRGLSDSGGIFSSSVNDAGGTIWTSTGTIKQQDFAPMVNSGLYNGNVDIISGIHGFKNGTTKMDMGFYLDDVKSFGHIDGVNVYDFNVLSSSELTEILRSPNTIIGGFCDSEVVLKPFK